MRMTPTTFQTARRENRMRMLVTGQCCPCGKLAIKRDGTGYVCADCVERDKVAVELLGEIHDERGSRRLTAKQAVVAKERKRVKEWQSRRRKRSAQVDITPLPEGAVASSGNRVATQKQ